MAVSIELKLDPLVKMEAKRHLNDTGRKKVASEVKRLCDPYVPFDTGMLKNTAQVLTDGVLYVQTYAAVAVLHQRRQRQAGAYKAECAQLQMPARRLLGQAHDGG